MSATTIKAGGTVAKDPSAERVYTVDWDANLPAAASIDASSWFIFCDDEAVPALTYDFDSRTARTTSLRLKAGTAGRTYKVTNRIVTNESPTQTDERSFYVAIGQL